jgi:hypothetical protein
MTQGTSSISSAAAAADDAVPDFRELTEPQMVQLEDADTLVSDQICQQISDRPKGVMDITIDDGAATTIGLMRRAWTIAAQLQYYKVELEHALSSVWPQAITYPGHRARSLTSIEPLCRPCASVS